MFGIINKNIDPKEHPRLLQIFKNTSYLYLCFFLIFQFLQTLFRALRYRILISVNDEPKVPTLYHTFLITLVRNMTIDLLPARIGELSYVAMMNRGCDVSAKTCISSLSFSVLFDFIALFILIVGVILFQLISGDVAYWLVQISIAILVLILILIFTITASVKFILKRVVLDFNNKIKNTYNIKKRIFLIIQNIALSFEKTRKAGIFGRIFILSLLVRFCKYVGIYYLFIAVTKENYQSLYKLSFIKVISSLFSAEAGASLPIPSFMSFGAYEIGGSLTLTLLGIKEAWAFTIMLSLHIWSQLIEYSIGSIALIIFIFSIRNIPFKSIYKTEHKRTVAHILIISLLCIGILTVGLQYRKIKKLGSLKPPQTGKKLISTESQYSELSSDPSLKSVDGFIVWSSNRFGNHDIIMRSLNNNTITRLTHNSLVDYYPRISPDGNRIVFARSQISWVSQRNFHAWDIFIIDLTTRKERLITRNGNTPMWTSDGNYIYFQRNGNSIVKLEIASGNETELFSSDILFGSPDIMLITPSYNARDNVLAVTLRGEGRNDVVLIRENGKVTSIERDSCQLFWSPQSEYLYYVGKGGRKTNLFYRVDPQSLKKEKWLDLPGNFSHEYFPRVSNNGEYLVFGASSEGHEHDTADYEIFLWKLNSPSRNTIRITYHTGNDSWPDIYIKKNEM